MRRTTGILVLGLLLASLGNAAAQEEACRPEVDKLCKDIQAGEGRLIKCLQQHEPQLSDACKARVNTMSRFMACVDDVMHLCPKNDPWGGEAIACLRTHENDLSTACRNELRKIGP